MRRTCVVLAAAMLALGIGTGLAQEEKSEKSATAKRPDIYDTKADAKALVHAAMAKAKRDNSRVLVMLGGNWCGWCHKLHDVFKKDGEIARTLLYEYELVMIDTQANSAEALMKEWQVDNAQGVPYLVVLDDAGKVVTRQETSSLEEGDHHDAKKVLAFLNGQKAEVPDAQSVLDRALARAVSEDKRVFLHFGAPWCGWCHKLEDFLARPEIAEIVAKDFVDVKVDTDRMKGGEQLLAKYAKMPGGIPWFVFLDEQGKPLVTSDGEKGNIGYPVEPHEIAHFMAMLKQTKRRIEPAQLERIERTLKEVATQLRSPRPAPAAG